MIFTLWNLFLRHFESSGDDNIFYTTVVKQFFINTIA